MNVNVVYHCKSTHLLSRTPNFEKLARMTWLSITKKNRCSQVLQSARCGDTLVWLQVQVWTLSVGPWGWLRNRKRSWAIICSLATAPLGDTDILGQEQPGPWLTFASWVHTSNMKIKPQYTVTWCHLIGIQPWIVVALTPETTGESSIDVEIREECSCICYRALWPMVVWGVMNDLKSIRANPEVASNRFLRASSDQNLRSQKSCLASAY